MGVSEIPRLYTVQCVYAPLSVQLTLTKRYVVYLQYRKIISPESALCTESAFYTESANGTETV